MKPIFLAALSATFVASPLLEARDLPLAQPDLVFEEKDGLVMFIDANRGGTVAFGQLIPSTSEQLTQEEAEALGWLPDPIEP